MLLKLLSETFGDNDLTVLLLLDCSAAFDSANIEISADNNKHEFRGLVHEPDNPHNNQTEKNAVNFKGSCYFAVDGNLPSETILPSTAIYPQRLFCRELFAIGQSK